MEDAALLDLHDHLDDLGEEGPAVGLAERAPLRDVVEQVLHVLRALHDDEERVGPLERVDQTDHALDVLDTVKEVELCGDVLPVGLWKKDKKTDMTGDVRWSTVEDW